MLPIHDRVEPSDATKMSCENCESRRDFVRDALATVVALLGVSALAPVRELAALESTAPGQVRYPIPSSDGVSIDKKHQTMLARVGNELFAFSLSCPHQNTALKALPGSAGFQCPRHKSRYRQDGTFISGRATRNMDRLPITREGDTVVVDPDVAFESDKDAARWTAAVVRL